MEQKGYQHIELIPLLALIRDHNGDSTVYVYDGNGNLVSKTDADGYVTQYSYTALDLVKKINYNGAKEVSYQYNKVGELVQMDDWTGTNTFELDLLGRLQKMTDHKGNTVSYTYDAVGNQTGITYPDGSKTRSFYDAVYNLTSVIDADDGTYAYVYDDANRPVKLTYPNGWIEQYTYDAEGNLLKTVDTDPFQLYNKTPKVKYEYTYDAEGNVLTEFQRDSDATENLKSRTAFTYDALNRLTGSTRRLEVYPYDTLAYAYTYDTLGNLLKQSGPTKGEEDTYQYNDLNQMVSKHVCGYEQKLTRIYDYGYTYDKRGNLVKEEEICSPTTTGPRNITIATYLYDETNRMVQGTNKAGEVSAYTFNGLGVRVGTELILKDNTHGYTDFHCQTPSVETGIEKPEVVKTDYVIDYTRLNIDQRVLMKSEQDGYDFFYTYGLDKLQVMTIGEGSNWWGQSIKKCVNMAYVHTDRLGSVVNLSDQYGRVTARADYTDWGEVRRYTDITVDGGFRRLLLEITYATHEYDDVLNQFYAKARMYDADNKRFAAIDPILNPAEYSISNYVSDPMMLVQYLYVADNAVTYIDITGQSFDDVTRDLARRVIANPAAVWLTQNPNSFVEDVFYVAGFVRDSNGIYHTRQDALQQYGGYNILYDIVFDHATSMKAQAFEFTYDGQDYRFWAWKGDYLNLGAGAELGIYTRLNVLNHETDHWLVDTNLALPMTMNLTDKNGNLIANYSPTDPQWWITSFNPYYQKMQACDLRVTYTVDFSSNTGMYNAFIKSSSFKYDKRWSISTEEKYTVVLKF